MREGNFSISFDVMHLRMRAAAGRHRAGGRWCAACDGRSGPLGPEYEYEEDLTLSLDGSATLIVNASMPALVALRGLPLNPDPTDRAAISSTKQIEELYTSSYTQGRPDQHLDAAQPPVRRHSPDRARHSLAAARRRRSRGRATSCARAGRAGRVPPDACRSRPRRPTRWPGPAWTGDEIVALPAAPAGADPVPELALSRSARLASGLARQHPHVGAASRPAHARRADRLRGRPHART